MGDTPYKGLAPFEEGDWPYFFGREIDRSLVCANLIASRLTIFYGPSGVGKSSVLEAGARHHVNRVLAEEGRREVGHPEFVLAVFRSWRDDPASGILAAAREAVEEATGRELPAGEPALAAEGGLADALEEIAGAFGGTLLLVLDQFEEFFNYQNGPNRLAGSFEALVGLLQRLRLGRRERVAAGEASGEGDPAGELPEERDSVGYHVHVMISIRDDALSKLDCFQTAVPDLFARTLRLDPLDREQAEQAIVGPLERYNERWELGADGYRVEAALVEQVLEGVRSGEIDLGEAGLGRRAGEGEDPRGGQESGWIELAYLQLVMARLWEVEQQRGSRELRLATFQEQGGALGIVRSHLDKVLGVLSGSERRLAGDLFRYLVTPSGSKIAQTIDSLAEWTRTPPKRVEGVLWRLAASESRVVRDAGALGGRPAFEIYHDVLAKVLPEYVRAREVERTRARVGRLSAVVLLLGCLLAVAVREWWVAKHERHNAEQQTKLAVSRMLSGNALEVGENELDLGLLLSLEAHESFDTPDARNSLAVGLGTNPSLVTYLGRHEGAARQVALEPGGKRLASCGEDGFIRLWDLETRRPAGRILVGGSERKVQSVAFSPDGKRLAAGDKLGEIFLYDMGQWPPRETRVARVKEVRSLAFHPNGRGLASGGGDGEVYLWDVNAPGRHVRRLEGQVERVHSVAFSPDGKRLASGGDSGLLVWDVASGQALGKLEQPHKDTEGGKDYVGAVAFSPDGKRLASAGADRRVILWTLREGSDGAGDEPWAREKVALERVHTDSILSLAFSPDSRTLCSAGWDNIVNVWDVSKPEGVGKPRALVGHRGYVQGLAFLPGGMSLASASMDRSVILWTLTPRHRLATELRPAGGKDVLCVAFAEGGEVMATGGEGGELLLWDGGAMSERMALEGHHETVHAVAFSHFGGRLASGGGKGELFLWDLTNSPPAREALKGSSGDIRSVAFSPDGRTLATGGADWEVVLWDLWSNPKRARRIDGMGLNGHEPRKEKAHETNVRSVAFSPDGETLATGGEDFRVTVWDLSGPEPRPRTLPDVIKGWVQSLAFSPDGKTLAAGSWYDDVALWDVGTWKRRPRLIGPRINVASVSFSPDGKTLASGGEGMAVALWDLERQRCSGDLRAGGEKSVRGVAFAPDGRSLVAVAEGGSVTRWNVEFATWVRQACAVANRNLTEEEWRGYIGGAKPYRRTCPDADGGDRRDHAGH